LSRRAQAARAEASAAGTISTSTNWRSSTVCAVALSSGRLNATMPPNADVGSVR
jgi:hypothetical protein